MLMRQHQKTNRTVCWTPAMCRQAKKFLMSSTLISADIETIPFQKKTRDRPFVMTINCYTGLHPNGEMESFCFPFQNSKSMESDAPTYIYDIWQTCVDINNSGIRFTGQNFCYDLIWYLRYGMPVANYAYDSMTLFWAKWPELPKRLDFISSILLDDYQYWKAGRKSSDFMEYCNYGMSDTEYTLRNTIILIQMALADPKMMGNFVDAHSRCVAALSMSAKGMRVNPYVMEKMGEELREETAKQLERVRYLVADPEFNPNSPKQKLELIYGLLGAKKRNAKGRFVSKDSDASTGATTLRAMRADHPIFRRVANGILEAIEPSKQLSNVVGLEFLRQRDGSDRFLTAYDGVATTTTRLGSRKSSLGHGGNAQNIRKDYRKFLEADTDSFLLDIDFSGADDVFVAFESEEPKKIELVRSGRDIHATNALIFFENWTYDSIIAGKKAKDPRVVHPITGVRQITKKLCHGMSYLMAGVTLLMTAQREAIVAAALELGYADAGVWKQDKLVQFCNMLEERFRAHYPRLKRSGADSWYSEVRQELIKTGGVNTIFGYFQRFMGDPYDDTTLRAAAATKGQANTAGRINMVMDELLFGKRKLVFRDGFAPDMGDVTLTVSELSHGISMRMQTHDSLTFNVRHTHPKWREGVKNIFTVMSRPVICKGEEFRVNIEAEVSYAWAGNGITIKNNSDPIPEIETFLSGVEYLVAGN